MASIIALTVLAGAGLAAGVLALPQLYPTLELTGLSNRGGGLSQLQAMAFSWNPVLAARGLLPSYDAQIFGEYIATAGVIGLGLMLIGATNIKRGTAVWLLLALIGILFELGAYTPFYWMVSGLPGFNLFRVPARWLALFALGGAMLAGIGVQTLSFRRPSWRTAAGIAAVIALLAASTWLADRAAAEVNGPAQPTIITIGAWLTAGLVLVGLIVGRKWIPGYPAVLVTALVVELFAASWVMPFNDVVDPAAYHDARMSVYQLKTLYDDDNPPGRLLSISYGYFDPGDKSGMLARYQTMGLDERAIDHAFTAAKLKELAAPNLPLVWNIPTIDGFGGGLVPTTYYTQFTSLLLPPGMLRTVDGRLRENLALAECRGACIPARKWLNLTNTRYLITDKTFDLVADGIFFDTAFTFPAVLDNLPDFTADSVQVVFRGDTPQINGQTVSVGAEIETGLRVGVITFEPQIVDNLTLNGDTIIALSLVDSRTGDFVQMTPDGWRRVLSSDIKLYENGETLPRAFVVHDVVMVGDDWDGTEQALEILKDVDVRETVVVHVPISPRLPTPTDGEWENTLTPFDGEGKGRAEIVRYKAERVEVRVETEREGYLFLSDAFYPGWGVTVNNEEATLYRANAMFRAVWIPAGESTVVFRYEPVWLPGVFIVGGVGWLVLIVLLFVSMKRIKI
jgi:hypothetical protein